MAASRAGLSAVHSQMVFIRDGKSMAVADAMKQFQKATLNTGIIKGRGVADKAISVPYNGDVLVGDKVKQMRTSSEVFALFSLHFFRS